MRYDYETPIVDIVEMTPTVILANSAEEFGQDEGTWH